MTPGQQNPPRRLRLVLRDHRVLEADAGMPPGQSLAAYLTSRTRYLYLSDIAWLGTGERMAQMALKVDSILWAFAREADASATDATAPVPAPEAGARALDVEFEGGYLLRARLMLVEGQRLADFLQSAPAFIPLRAAELRPRGRALGDIVVNQHAIQVVREIPADEADAEAAAWGDGGADPGSPVADEHG